jgi:ABC-type branched-subunit amino acid transport system substrate-binding protein
MEKRKTSWQIVLIMLVLAALALSSVSCAQQQQQQAVEKPKELKMGLSLILTGPIEGTGEPISFGALHYFQYLNEELGGIEYLAPDGKKDRVKLEIIVGENKYNAEKSAAVYKLHKSLGVDFMASFGTTPGMIVSPLASADKMPVINFYAMATPAHFAPQPSYCTSGFANIAEHAGLVLKWFKETQWKGSGAPKVGIMMLDIPGFRYLEQPAGAPAIKAFAEGLGVQLLDIAWIPPSPAGSQIHDALVNLYNQKPDLVIVGHLANQMGPILKESANVGFDLSKTPFVAPAFAFDETLIAAAGKASEGLYGAIIAATPGEDLPGVNLAKTISEKYYGEPLSLLYLEGVFYAMEIEAIIRQALETTGFDKLTADAINNASHNLKDFDSKGITPKITIDPKYPMLNPWGKIAMVKDGKFVPVSDWYQYPAIRGFMP